METKLPTEPAIQQFRGPAHESINKKPIDHLVIEIRIRDGDGSILAQHEARVNSSGNKP